jgi:hypothetical protein
MSDEQYPWDDELPQGIEGTLTPEMMEYAVQRAAESMATAEEAYITGRVILGRRWCTACRYPKECGQDFRCCSACNHPVMVATPLETAKEQSFLVDNRTRWCTACGYSLWSCTNFMMSSDPQGIPCCDVCNHPVWIATPMEEEE